MMKDKRMKQKKLANDNSIDKSLDNINEIKKKVYTPDGGNISTGVTTDDAYIKIN